MTPPTPLTAAEVAGLLHMTADTFYRRRLQLERDDGFPPPFHSSGRELLWDPRQIDAWMLRRCPADLRETIAPAVKASEPAQDWDIVIAERLARRKGAA